MTSPAYVWIEDENGNEIKSDCLVQGRQGAIEALAFEYGVEMPVDRFNGSTTGTRQHRTAKLTKVFCPASPVLFQAACDGRNLQRLTIKWYEINDSGSEQEYFTHVLEDVKVVCYSQKLSHTKVEKNNSHAHEDSVEFRFSKIIMKHHNGNIEASDTWLKRS